MTTPEDPHTKTYSHINGTQAELLDRLAVAELCKGWPVYRDASEWQNFRSLFTDNAYVWTTWSSAVPIDTFIAISQAGKSAGVFIMHRECGTLVELNAPRKRALGKMKATITHRFGDYDVDCDCRFIFFCEKIGGEWKVRYVKLFYEKDKVVPVSGQAPRFKPEELVGLPEGYAYLGAAQARLGYKIDRNLPTARGLKGWKKMYAEMEKWVDGNEVNLFWGEPAGAKL